MQLVEGTEIGGYRVEGLLGAGGMGAVYRARQVSLGRDVALKVLVAGIDAEESEQRRFKREMDLQLKLNHPHLVQVLDAGVDEGRLYLVSELVEGEDLEKRIEASAPFGVEATFQVVRGLAEALEYLHRNRIVHRDIKPGNVLISHEGEVKLTDFGLARGDHNTMMTRVSQLLGTPRYMAPEIVGGQGASQASDVFALGIIGYRMLTGRYPYKGHSFLEYLQSVQCDEPVPLTWYRPDIRRSLTDLLMSMLVRHPDDRPTAGAVSEALDLELASASRTVELDRDEGAPSCDKDPTELARERQPIKPAARNPTVENPAIRGARPEVDSGSATRPLAIEPVPQEAAARHGPRNVAIAAGSVMLVTISVIASLFGDRAPVPGSGSPTVASAESAEGTPATDRTTSPPTWPGLAAPIRRLEETVHGLRDIPYYLAQRTLAHKQRLAASGEVLRVLMAEIAAHLQQGADRVTAEELHGLCRGLLAAQDIMVNQKLLVKKKKGEGLFDAWTELCDALREPPLIPVGPMLRAVLRNHLDPPGKASPAEQWHGEIPGNCVTLASAAHDGSGLDGCTVAGFQMLLLDHALAHYHDSPRAMDYFAAEQTARDMTSAEDLILEKMKQVEASCAAKAASPWRAGAGVLADKVAERRRRSGDPTRATRR